MAAVSGAVVIDDNGDLAGVEEVTDAELAASFDNYARTTGEYSRSARLAPAERERVLKITNQDWIDAFDLDLGTVRRIQRLRRNVRSTPLDKPEKPKTAPLKAVVPQRVSNGSNEPLTAGAIRIAGVSLTPREGVQ